MNIFKILANGDGTINEANISAFLGYLLDPYQDHGLGHEFLDRVMQEIEFLDRVMQEIEFLKSEDLNFNTYKYEYEVLFEQAFRDEDKELKKKEIVDIVILCFETNKGNYKELIASNTVEKVRELKYIILLENKVSTGSKTVHQLKNQYENTIKSLNINQDKVISIYLTPDDKKYEEEFNNFTENQKKTHLVWITNNERNKLEENEEEVISVYKILKEIITDESNCRIEAINDYTKHTLISFIKFIENDFKSQIKEKQETKEGKFQKDISYSLDSFIDKYGSMLSNESIEQIKAVYNHFNVLPNFIIRHSKTHPLTAIYNNKKIFGLTKQGKNCIYHFLLRDRKEILNSFINDLELRKIKIKKTSFGFIINEKVDTDEIIEFFTTFFNTFIKNKS